MEIKIGIGLDNLVFGMSQEDVKSIMGEPDKISETERENEIVYYFNDLLISATFDKNEDCRMYSIEVFNPKVFMFNQQIVNKDKNEILDLLKSNGYYEVKEEECDFVETIFCEETWSTFTFEFSKLRSIEISPLYANDDEIIWPSIKDSVQNEKPRPQWNCEALKEDRTLEIKIGIGLEDLVFGMSQEDVKSIMGEPDKISETEREDGIVYYFNGLLIKTKFHKDEDCRMYSIEIFNQGMLMFNQKIMNKTKNEILDLLKLNGYNEIEKEEYDFFETVFCREIWTTFTFEFNRLSSLEFSPLFKKEGKFVWPVTS